ncbi:Zinc finger protein 811 [Apodemus speciosus]|uniref:Zinc finger protein 811 n=1 Tax=Apodemus speciosus TaxID=105296 RepID=A0ABQ0FNT5_APOSI
MEKLRCQLVEKLPDCKESHECAEIFKLSTEGTVNHTFYPRVHICKGNGFVNVLIGHLAVNVRLKPRPGQKSKGVQEHGKDVYSKDSESSSCSPLSLWKHRSAEPAEKSTKTKQSEDFRLGQNHEGTPADEKRHKCGESRYLSPALEEARTTLPHKEVL